MKSYRGFPGGSEVKASACSAGDLGSSWEDPLEKEWQPTPVCFPGESHGGRSLVGYSPWGRRVRHDWATSLQFTMSTKCWNLLFMYGWILDHGPEYGCRITSLISNQNVGVEKKKCWYAGFSPVASQSCVKGQIVNSLGLLAMCSLLHFLNLPYLLSYTVVAQKQS